MNKICTKCGIEKDVVNFRIVPRGKFGVRGECKDCEKKYNIIHGKIYYQNNKDKWIISRESRKEQINKQERERRKNDLNFRIRGNLKVRIRTSLKGLDKSKNTEKLLGCSIEFFRSYLESQFTEGMSWLNYGEWEIDHIK